MRVTGLFILLCAILSACGGSGSDDGSGPTRPGEPPMFAGQISSSVTEFGHVDPYARVDCKVSGSQNGQYSTLVVLTGEYMAPENTYCLHRYTQWVDENVVYIEYRLSIQNGQPGRWYRVWVK